MNVIFILFLIIQSIDAKQQKYCFPLNQFYSQGFYNDTENECFLSESKEREIHFLIKDSFFFDTIHSINTNQLSDSIDIINTTNSTELNNTIIITSLTINKSTTNKPIILTTNSSQLIISQTIVINDIVDFQIPIICNGNINITTSNSITISSSFIVKGTIYISSLSSQFIQQIPQFICNNSHIEFSFKSIIINDEQELDHCITLFSNINSSKIIDTSQRKRMKKFIRDEKNQVLQYCPSHLLNKPIETKEFNEMNKFQDFYLIDKSMEIVNYTNENTLILYDDCFVTLHLKHLTNINEKHSIPIHIKTSLFNITITSYSETIQFEMNTDENTFIIFIT